MSQTIERPKIKFAGRLLYDVKKEMELFLARELEHSEYFTTIMDSYDEHARRRFPKNLHWHRPAIYTVQGGSEGWYVHFDLLNMKQEDVMHPRGRPGTLEHSYGLRTLPVWLAKFWSLNEALTFSNALTRAVIQFMYDD